MACRQRETLNPFDPTKDSTPYPHEYRNNKYNKKQTQRNTVKNAEMHFVIYSLSYYLPIFINYERRTVHTMLSCACEYYYLFITLLYSIVL